MTCPPRDGPLPRPAELELTDGILRRLAAVVGGFRAFELTLSETHRLGWGGDIVLSLRPSPRTRSSR